MKICMIVNNSISRDPRVKGEALALIKAGHEVTVIGSGHRDLPEEEVWNGIKFKRIFTKDIHRKLSAGLKAIKRLPINKKKFLEFYKQNRIPQIEDIWIAKATEDQYDVYHAHDLDTLNIAYLSSKKNNSKLVYDSHELWIEWQKNKNNAPLYLLEKWEMVENEVAPQVDMLITVSDGIANELKNMYKLETNPLVIYNCAELREHMRLNVLRENYIYSDSNRKIVLYQGGIQSGRGLENFINIAKFCPGLDFVIIGPVTNQNYGDYIKKLAENIPNLFVLQPVPYEELWKITCSADFGYVCTEPICKSYDLGLSNKIFEYMVAGLPIIASSVKGHMELKNKLPDDMNPFYFIDHNEPESSANMLENAAKDSKLIEYKGKNARIVAEQRYNREFEFSKLIEGYKNII